MSGDSLAKTRAAWSPEYTGFEVERLETRGVVLTPEDLSFSEWPHRAKEAGLTTIALHHSRDVTHVSSFVQKDEGAAFLAACGDLGLEVEYELHAMKDLLPRDLFDKEQSLFRMDDNGERVSDFNLCVHSHRALEIIAENAVDIGRVLRPTTGRYFLWGDDGRPWCRCPQCRHLSDSDQALIVANSLLHALRKEDPRAQVAHLAYLNTLAAPQLVKPQDGVFLEYAPIRRRYDIPYADQTGSDYANALELLDANLALFERSSAQALEYWLDASLFTRSQKPRPATVVKVPWHPEVFTSDVRLYAERGVRHITSFACMIDATYVAMYGEPPLREYAAALSEAG
jgi:hypothetical protein